MKHSAVSLDDKYQTDIERVYLTGTQALVRLPLLQRKVDLRSGLNTAGFVSGYRGSPLGAVDIQMWQAREHLEAKPHPLSARRERGTGGDSGLGHAAGRASAASQIRRRLRVLVWKGPGRRSCGDVFKHANFAGSARNGGVLLVAGDDHACKSSTVPHQSEQAFAAASVPVLVPADVREILEFGLHGWAMSRWSGRYVGFKTVADVVDSSASVAFDLASFWIMLAGRPAS